MATYKDTKKTKATSKKRLIDSRTREKIVAQALLEIEFDRDYKKKRIEDWHRNEKLIAHVNENLGDQRANVGIANTKAISFVETLLSKVDNAPNIKFVKTTEADLNVANRYNGLFQMDMAAENQDLDFKDLMGKKDAIVYGRAIYDYHAESVNGYCSHLNLVSPYDFLIDPSAGGMYTERARHLGRAGIWKDKWELEAGAKTGFYINDEVKEIVKGAGQSNAASQEQKDKEEGLYFLTGEKQRMMNSGSQYHFHEWGTTYEGERYLLLINEESKRAVRCEKLKDVFKSGMWWFGSWATSPDAKEFWTLAPIDNVRNIFITQGINIDQALDNNERINHPMMGVVAGAVKNLSDLRYGRDKRVLFKKGTDLRIATKTFETPQIDNPLKIYEVLEGIGDKEGGVPASSKGVADEETLGIYEGNLANVSDRLGLLNKSYARFYKHLGLLWKKGVQEHMTKKMAIEILGADGVSYEDVTAKDMTPNSELKVVVEASDAEVQSNLIDKKNKLTFLASKKGDPTYNQRVVGEMEATIAGFKKEDIDRLLDVENAASAELMAEAAQEIEDLIALKEVEPNWQANTKYVQKFVDYMQDNKNDLSDEQWIALENYVLAVQPIVIKNTVRMAQAMRSEMLKGQIEGARLGGGAIPPQAGGEDPLITRG